MMEMRKREHNSQLLGIKPASSSYGWICTMTIDGDQEGIEDRMNSLVALGLLALLAIIMLTPQSASANNIGGFDCFGQSNCVAGWNDAIGKATSDWNSGHGYDYYVYHWADYCMPYHSYSYCDGYWHSYNYEWNQLAQEQNQQSNQQSI
jgi:hypothetical protein